MQARPLTLNENIENVKTEICLRAARTVCGLLLKPLTHSRLCIVQNGEPQSCCCSVSAPNNSQQSLNISQNIYHTKSNSMRSKDNYLIKYGIVLSSRIHFIMNHFSWQFGFDTKIFSRHHHFDTFSLLQQRETHTKKKDVHNRIKWIHFSMSGAW